MNAFEDSAFGEAVKTTGKKRLIIGGLHTEICLTFASVQALKDGYEVMYVADAVGGRSQIAHRTAIERLAQAVVTELFRDWGTPLVGRARDVIYWYFNEVPKHTDQIGVAEAEKLAAAAAGPTEVSGPAAQARSASPRALVEALPTANTVLGFPSSPGLASPYRVVLRGLPNTQHAV